MTVDTQATALHYMTAVGHFITDENLAADSRTFTYHYILCCYCGATIHGQGSNANQAFNDTVAAMVHR